jgi:hypothetical protein
MKLGDLKKGEYFKLNFDPTTPVYVMGQRWFLGNDICIVDRELDDYYKVTVYNFTKGCFQYLSCGCHVTKSKKVKGLNIPRNRPYKITLELEVSCKDTKSAQALAEKYKDSVSRLVLRPRTSGLLPTRVLGVEEIG